MGGAGTALMRTLPICRCSDWHVLRLAWSKLRVRYDVFISDAKILRAGSLKTAPLYHHHERGSARLMDVPTADASMGRPVLLSTTARLLACPLQLAVTACMLTL
jgi:hypothetical protein